MRLLHFLCHHSAYRIQLLVTRLTVHFLVIFILVGTGYLIFLAAGNAHIHRNEVQLHHLVQTRTFIRSVIALFTQFQVIFDMFLLCDL